MRLITILFLLIVGQLSFGQNREQKIDSLLTSLYDNGKFNGNVLVAEKGEVIYKKSFGLANEMTKEKLNENSIFDLASVTKQFTAMAIVILKEKGKLEYDDKISKYIPELSDYGNVTIRNLLNHTSGLPDYIELMDSLFDKSKIATNQDIITLLAEHKPKGLFEPNTKWVYSNTGYALLASVIERISGMSYGDYLNKMIFEPLGMYNTFVYRRRYDPKKVTNYAYGYVYSDSLKKNVLPDDLEETKMVIWLDGIVGDGILNSNVNDLLKWDRALYTDILISKESKNEIFTAAELNDKTKTNYGFGWFLYDNVGFGRTANHSGGWCGYKSYIDRHIDDDKTIIILQNHDDGVNPVKFIRSILYNIPLPVQSFEAQVTPPIIPLPGSYQAVSGSFLLNSETTVYMNDASFSEEALFLQKALFDTKKLPVSIQSTPGKRSISLLKSGQAGNNKEGYSLKMSPEGITISAARKEGIFRGITSLLHLVIASKDHSVACWNIEDAPRYEWRGFMLDESRHFFGKQKVKQLLDWMAFYKLNRFHWHLTDEPGWRIEIKKYPLLGHIGGIGNFSDHDAAPNFYTQEEIREIVQYAAERKIVVIPEIDMPGHARAANRAYPQFSGGGSERYPEFTFDPGNEGTYQYLTDILKEVDVLFPSEMIHLGGDEVHFGNEAWHHNQGIKDLMAKHKLKDLPQVEKYFMVRMADSLFAMNNKILAWDEMADISLPAEKTLIFWWRHDQPEQLEKALEKNYQVVLCPRIPYYLDFVQDSTHTVGRRWGGAFADLEKAYSFSPEKWVKGNRLQQVVGMQANLWTEVIATNERLEFMTFPRMSALSEAAWGQNNYYDDYLERLKLQIPLYQKENLYFFNPFDISNTPEPKR